MIENECDVTVRAGAGPAPARRPAHVERLVLQIHNASFPSEPEEDLGRGTPYSRGAERFCEFAKGLGFNVIQLGPRGMTDRGNPSPYSASIFSRNPLDLPLRRYVDDGRLSRATWDAIRRALPPAERGVVPYRNVFDGCQTALAEIVANASSADRAQARRFLDANRDWLVPDALYHSLYHAYGGRTWADWNRTPQELFDQRLYDPLPGEEESAAARLARLEEEFAPAIEDYALVQWLLDDEARSFRKKLSALGMAAYGDLQVGLSHQDVWVWRRVFLDGYLMGASPSRTNPDGQPWGYPVLDPDQIGTPESPGPALLFVRARITRLLSECAGVRIDHPHGWVDPWVYRSDLPDPFLAVLSGARLFSSPDDPNHPRLARFAICRPDQIDRTQSLHADGHVARLEEDQVRRYSLLMDEIVRQQRRAGHATSAIACEVLSTLPYPVRRVLERHGLGRFRVTQKLSLTDPTDVYRIEQAAAEDWIMLGTHDTPPVWQLAETWCRSGVGNAWQSYLSELGRSTSAGDGWADDVAESPGRLVNAIFTAMLSSRARNVVVFFADLLGLTERYNAPGIVSDENWSLRVPADFETSYPQRVRAGRALDVENCLRAAASRAP